MEEVMQEGSVMQVAYLVRDLEAAMKRHWEVCGMGPWDVYEFRAPKVRDYLYRGKPATHTCLIAVTWNDHLQLELIQPVSGRSIYDEHLETRGEGLHHVKLFHADCVKAVEEYSRRGYPVIQSGKFDEDEHYYLDTEKDFGYIIELGNAGKIRAAERRYPS
jgi:methylmalonyl-CoA/ethylmalonyl-CoA epimerase